MHSDVRSARLHVIVRLTRDLRTNHLQTKYVRNNSWRDPLIGIQLEREIQDFLVCRAHVEHSRKSRGTVRASFFSSLRHGSAHLASPPSMTRNVWLCAKRHGRKYKSSLVWNCKISVPNKCSLNQLQGILFPNAVVVLTCSTVVSAWAHFNV